MSADNGVYVLVTEGPEYRVAYAQAIGNIYDEYDEESGKWLPNVGVIYEAFDDSEVFDDLEDALDDAEALSEEYEFLEDGVCIISDFADLEYSNLEGN